MCQLMQESAVKHEPVLSYCTVQTNVTARHSRWYLSSISVLAAFKPGKSQKKSHGL
jgi:hypothetical protein